MDRMGQARWYRMEVGDALVEVVTVDFGDEAINYVHGELTEDQKVQLMHKIPLPKTIHFIEEEACL